MPKRIPPEGVVDLELPDEELTDVYGGSEDEQLIHDNDKALINSGEDVGDDLSEDDDDDDPKPTLDSIDPALIHHRTWRNPESDQ